MSELLLNIQIAYILLVSWFPDSCAKYLHELNIYWFLRFVEPYENELIWGEMEYLSQPMRKLTKYLP